MQFLDFSRLSSLFPTINPKPHTPVEKPPILPDPEQIAIDNDLQKVLEKSTEWSTRLQLGKANEQTLINDKSWLNHLPWDGKLPEQDFNFFALLNGDGFVYNTPHDGYQYSKSMEHYIHFFEALLSQKDSPDVQTFNTYFPKIQIYLDQLKAAKIISEKMDQIAEQGQGSNSKKQNELILKYAEELNLEFKTGSMEWFPAGWRDSSEGGHAMLLKFEKNGSIAFVNSGGGLEYHHYSEETSHTDGASTMKKKAQQFLTLKGVNKERFGSVDFFRFLLEIHVSPKWAGNFKPTSKTLYEGLFEYLGGKKDEAYDANKHPQVFKTPQRSGSCCVKSISTGLYYHLCGIWGDKEKHPEQAVTAYKKIKFLWERQSLLSQCVHYLPKPSELQAKAAIVEKFDPSTERLFEDIMQNMGRESESLYNKKQLSSNEMVAIHATFLDIRNRIAAIKEFQAKILSEKMSCERNYKIPTDIVQPFSTKIPFFPEKNGKVILSSHNFLTPSEAMSRKIMLEPFKKLTEPKEASKTLKSWQHCLEPILSQEYFKRELYLFGPRDDFCKVVLDRFQDILCNLPIPNNDKAQSFWQQIPEDQILDCMRSVKQLMNMLSFIKLISSNSSSADTITTSYAFLAIMDQLARRIPESGLKSDQNINYYDLLMQVKSPRFINTDLHVQDQLTKVLCYFDPNHSIENDIYKTNGTLFHESLNSLFNFTNYKGKGPELVIDKDTIKENPTLLYMKQFLRWNDPVIKKKLEARGISPSQSLVQQLQLMLWDKSKTVKQESVLPESVQLLQQASIHCAAMTRPFARWKILNDSKLTSMERLPDFTFVDGKCFTEGEYSEEVTWIVPSEDHYDKLLLEPLLNQAKSQQVDKAEESQFNELLLIDYKKRRQNEVIYDSKTFFGLNLEDSRELCMLGVDPYDEANRTISFARRHLALLRKSKIQDLIYLHLFKQGRMLSQLSDSPEFADQIAEFLEEALDYYIKASDPQTCLFLIKIGQKMKTAVEKCGIKPQKPFPDFHKIILHTLIPTMKDVGDIKRSCEMIVKWHTPSKDDGNTDPDTLKKIAETIILTSIVGRLETRKQSTESNLGLDLITKTTMNYWMPKVLGVMTNDQVTRDKILNHALRISIEEVGHTNWTGEFPTWKSGIYEIDVEKGSVKKNGQELVTLPDAIVRHEDFKKLKIKAISHVTLKDDHIYIIHPDLIEISHITPHFEIRKQINGSKYLLRSDLNIEFGKKYPTICDEETTIWMCDGSLNFAFAPHCLVLKAEKKPVKIHLDNRNDCVRTTAIEQGDYERVPFQYIPSSLQKILSPIEPNEAYIDCWRPKNKDNVIKKFYLNKIKNDLSLFGVNPKFLHVNDNLASFSLKRLGLNFIVQQKENESLAFCQEFPGFFLAESRYVPQLCEEDPYVVLENAKGEKKIIFPKILLSYKFEKQPDTTLKRNLEKEIPKNASKEWLEFSIKDGELHSAFVEPSLYLSYFFLAKGNYEKAGKILKQLNSARNFTENDIGILSWMCNLAFEDKHPASRVLFLFLFSLIEDNKLKFPESKVGTTTTINLHLNKVCQIYIDYMQNRGNIPQFQFSEEEEKRILIFLQNGFKKEIRENPNAEQSRAFLEQINKRLVDFTNRSSLIGVKPLIKPSEKSSLLNSSDKNMLQHWFEEYLPFKDKPRFIVDSMLMIDSRLLRTKFVEFYDVATSGSSEERKKLKAFLDLQKGNLKDEESEIYHILQTVCRFPFAYSNVSYFKEVIEKRKAAPWNDAQANTKCERVFERELGGTYFLNLGNVIYDLVSDIFSNISSLFAFPKLFNWKQRWKSPSDGKVLKSTMLLLNGEPLRNIDKAFNRYFNKLIDTYFLHEDVETESATEHLPVDHVNPLVRDKLKQENADLDAFEKMRPKKRRMHKLRPDADIQQLEGTLKKETIRWESTLKTQQQALIWQANCIAEGTDPNKNLAIHKQAHQVKVTWEDLQDCFCKGNIESFQKRTQLNEKEINGLFQGIADYSIKKCRLDQMKHIIVAIKGYEKNTQEFKKESESTTLSELAHSLKTMGPLKKTSLGISAERQKKEMEYKKEEAQAKAIISLEQVVAAMSLFPSYEKTSANRAEILFELANSFFYRQEQIKKHAEILKNIKVTPEILAQMRTGYGKTKTTVPTLDVELAKQGNLVVNVWPASLEETNTQDVKTQLKKSFARSIDAMKFDRSTKLNADILEKRFLELQNDIREGRPLNLRPETIRALEVHLISMLDECHSKQVDVKEYEKQLEYLLKIHHLIRMTSVAFIDEAKHNLDPKDKLIYTIGNPQTLPKDDVDFIEDIFEILSSSPFEELLDIENNNQPLMSKEVYDEKIVLELIKIFEKKWTISIYRRNDFRQFVLGERSGQPFWMKDHPQKNQMALLKGEVLFILNSACRGYVDKQFGLSKKHPITKQFAIPYISANIPKETERAPSECKNPHETLNKTYITYLNKGLAKDQIATLIETLQKSAFNEVDAGVPFDKTAANKFYIKMLPNAKKPLYKLDGTDIESLHSKLHHNKQAIFFYIRNVVVPQIVFYPKSITSTTQNFRSQFAKSISLSATPQDAGAHGPDTLLIPVSGTEGEVTHVLYTKCKDSQTLQQLKATTSQGILQETQRLTEKDPSMHATVDVGGLYTGISNQMLAKQTCESLRKSRANIEAVIFFDDQGSSQRFMVMNVLNEQVQPLDGCNLDPKNGYTIYDQHRSYGSDIPQAFSAKGLILLSKETTKSEAAQGWGRFRQGNLILDGKIKGQSPVFALPLNMSQDIFGKKDPNIADLLTHLVANEAIANAEFNYESLKEQMDNEIRRALLDKIEGLNIGESSKDSVKDPQKIQVNVSKALKLFAYFEKELIKEENFDPILLYSTAPKAEDTILFLERYQARCIERVKKYQGLTANERKFIIERLQKYSDKWKGKDNSLALPKEVKATSTALGMSCEVFNEVETQVNTQAEVLVTGNLRNAAPWQDSIDLFKTGWEKPSYRFTTLKKLAAKVSNVVLAIIKFWDKLPELLTGFITVIAVEIFPISVLIILPGAVAEKFVYDIALKVFLVCSGILLLSSHNYIASTRIWKWLTTTKSCKNYRLKDLLGTQLPGKIANAKQFFSPNFLCSDNFNRQNTLGIVEPIQKVFDVEQKPLFQVLVIQDEIGGKKHLQFMAIDQNDSQYFRRRFKNDQGTNVVNASKRTRKIAMVDVRSGKIVAQGKNKFEKDELDLNPDYQSLMTQAKLFDGEILYTEAEQAQLRESVNKVGQKVMREFFEECVLPLHPLNKHCYVNKPIAQILGKVA